LLSSGNGDDDGAGQYDDNGAPGAGALLRVQELDTGAFGDQIDDDGRIGIAADVFVNGCKGAGAMAVVGSATALTAAAAGDITATGAGLGVVAGGGGAGLAIRGADFGAGARLTAAAGFLCGGGVGVGGGSSAAAGAGLWPYWSQTRSRSWTCRPDSFRIRLPSGKMCRKTGSGNGALCASFTVRNAIWTGRETSQQSTLKIEALNPTKICRKF
jgi:hypothetical protein